MTDCTYFCRKVKLHINSFYFVITNWPTIIARYLYCTSRIFIRNWRRRVRTMLASASPIASSRTFHMLTSLSRSKLIKRSSLRIRIRPFLTTGQELRGNFTSNSPIDDYAFKLNEKSLEAHQKE